MKSSKTAQLQKAQAKDDSKATPASSFACASGLSFSN
jgi:hypothetical protein